MFFYLTSTIFLWTDGRGLPVLWCEALGCWRAKISHLLPLLPLRQSHPRPITGTPLPLHSLLADQTPQARHLFLPFVCRKVRKKKREKNPPISGEITVIEALFLCEKRKSCPCQLPRGRLFPKRTLSSHFRVSGETTSTVIRRQHPNGQVEVEVRLSNALQCAYLDGTNDSGKGKGGWRA